MLHPPRAVTFGWGWPQHAAIEKAALNLLPSSALKNRLMPHIDTVHQVSVNQDRHRLGPGHYVHAEKHGATLQINRAEHQFDVIRQHFTLANKRRQAKRFKEKPLRESDFAGSANVFQSVVEAYRQLVARLKPASLATDEQVAESVGILAHYVGDMFQPMHTTQYYSWKLAHPRRGGAHAHLERRMLADEDYSQWREGFEKGAANAPKPLRPADIPGQLLRAIERNYLRVFDLAAVDRRARSGATRADAYFDQLRKGWQPIVEDQMGASARLLASLLQSAKAEAGHR